MRASGAVRGSAARCRPWGAVEQGPCGGRRSQRRAVQGFTPCLQDPSALGAAGHGEEAAPLPRSQLLPLPPPCQPALGGSALAEHLTALRLQHFTRFCSNPVSSPFFWLRSCSKSTKMEDSKEKIILIIGGVRYETYSSILQTFPGTKLCSLTEPHAPRIYDYDPTAKEFFFDRSAEIFSSVLNCYRTKHFHCPIDTCRSVLEEELIFWEINET
ncbi:potassium voltage-gated channel protein egl-36-like [Chiroxiphia lanceolata]|uniref:potassium voltage-gated channel protein egl-36-like n=1 Tax=Chiroxiphia lanceolata TaxID=296741 RepID=UPI0013CF0F72|nr:potassium voltage-gated channel protein egl-36-like [Chiroxiphia lanceolata]